MNKLNFKISLITTPDVDGQFASEICKEVEQKFITVLDGKSKVRSDALGLYLIVMPDSEMIETFSKGKFGRKTVTDLNTNTKLTYFTIPVCFLSDNFSKFSSNDLIASILESVIYFDGDEVVTKRNSADLAMLKDAAAQLLKIINIANK
jgi:hypothetical protein